MALQFIHDNKGNTTGIFIPIEEWQTLKAKYQELQKEEVVNLLTLSEGQKQIIDERLTDYYNHTNDTADFVKTIDDIEKGL